MADAKARQEFGDKMDRALVPYHLHGGLERYIFDGLEPGGFLTAVLENNLKEAFARGDENSLAGLRNLVTFLYNEVPFMCWGSTERVNEWIAGRFKYVNR